MEIIKENGFSLGFLYGFDERTRYETEARGWLPGTYVILNDKIYHVLFYDEVRCLQDVDAEINSECNLSTESNLFIESNVVVIKTVTYDEIIKVVKKLIKTNFFDTLKSGLVDDLRKEMPLIKNCSLAFLPNFDEREKKELESHGSFIQAHVMHDDKISHLNFYDIARLTYDMQTSLSDPQKEYFCINNIIVSNIINHDEVIKIIKRHRKNKWLDIILATIKSNNIQALLE